MKWALRKSAKQIVDDSGTETRTRAGKSDQIKTKNEEYSHVLINLASNPKKKNQENFKKAKPKKVYANGIRKVWFSECAKRQFPAAKERSRCTQAAPGWKGETPMNSEKTYLRQKRANTRKLILWEICKKGQKPCLKLSSFIRRTYRKKKKNNQ